MAELSKPRPVARPGANMRLIEALQYRLPLAALVSILHRASGMMMFFLLPFIVWMFDASVSSEVSYDGFTSAFVAGIGFVPGFVIKLIALALIWAYLHHAVAGLRHLWMDATHSVTKQQGHSSAVATFAISILLTVALGAKLFGLF
ncbi:succinate dehydrogenase, cytochrome b556 subunit [Pseudaquabacterium pictum]|uniref:Succinate dehydrogenase cytochrome b556 subunit n=1 Tax=Pseudaquabacterium pictum TaxID=2315236 RepID=A0A480B4M1_9BURK|nr:succinate dehydrogenase cytochrome b-556 subunit [Rubrivivax pictus]